jgi:hypothetical protein
LHFQAIKHHDDYLNFSITFTFDKHYCDVTGMGWMSNKKVHYYLSSIMMNKQYASFKEASEVGVKIVNDSAVFDFLQLDHLTKTYIKTNILRKAK